MADFGLAQNISVKVMGLSGTPGTVQYSVPPPGPSTSPHCRVPEEQRSWLGIHAKIIENLSGTLPPWYFQAGYIPPETWRKQRWQPQGVPWMNEAVKWWR